MSESRFCIPSLMFECSENCSLSQTQCNFSDTEKMVLLRQQNLEQQINFLLLQPKILLQQPNVLLIELNILLL